MITPQDIKDQLEVLIREKFPDEAFYPGRVPDSFTRPSNHVELSQCVGSVEVAPGIVELRPVFTITTFDKVDGYGYCDQRALSYRQMILTGILLPGYIKVKDRAPKVKAMELKSGTDFASVVVTFSLTLDRSDFKEMEQAPMAGHLAINFTEK